MQSLSLLQNSNSSFIPQSKRQFQFPVSRYGTQRQVENDQLTDLIFLCKQINNASSIEGVMNETLPVIQKLLNNSKVYFVFTRRGVNKGFDYFTVNSGGKVIHKKIRKNRILRNLPELAGCPDHLLNPVLFERFQRYEKLFMMPVKVKNDHYGFIAASRGKHSAPVPKLEQGIIETWASNIAMLARTLELKKMASTDYLTGLKIRRSFLPTVDSILHERNESQLFSFVLMDLDHFKLINDRFGHLKGDEILAQTGSIIKSSLRKNDICARIGGEEFALFLPGTGIENAKKIIERIQKKFLSLKIDEKTQPTASFGIVTGLTPAIYETIYKKADEALYTAKKRGRNQVFSVQL